MEERVSIENSVERKINKEDFEKLPYLKKIIVLHNEYGLSDRFKDLFVKIKKNTGGNKKVWKRGYKTY